MAENIGQSSYTKVRSSVAALVEESISKFQLIWEQIGFDEGEIEWRCNIVLNHTQQFLEDMLEEERTTLQQFIQKVERLLVEASQLEKELGIQHLNNFDMRKLKDAKCTLQSKVEEYRGIKQERMNRLAVYRRREAALCEALDIPPKPGFQNAVPTDVQFNEYESYLAEKEEEKERLMYIYRETKIAILALIGELGETPLLDFHKLVVYEDESKFKPTKTNMELLKDYHDELEVQVEQSKTIVLELREKLSLLWERLQQDTHHRELFLATHQGYSASTIHGLKEELKRCEELKCQNVKSFIKEIRKELADWWDKCLISKEERHKFTAYKSRTYTADLLELHEFELQRLKRYYEDNIDIFQLAIQWQKLWDKMLELEDRTKDPQRLFKNRGGQLLREEQDRKSIQKELPKVEKELLQYLEEYEVKHGSPFYIQGKRFKDRINHQWIHHKTHQESERSAKKRREHLLKMESKIGTQRSTTKRKEMPTTSPTSTKKRHVTTSSCKPRLNPAWKKEAEKRTAKVRRKILDRTRFMNTSAETSEQLAQPLYVMNSIDTTYSNFQDHLEE